MKAYYIFVATYFGPCNTEKYVNNYYNYVDCVPFSDFFNKNTKSLKDSIKKSWNKHIFYRHRSQTLEEREKYMLVENCPMKSIFGHNLSEKLILSLIEKTIKQPTYQVKCETRGHKIRYLISKR